MPKFSKYLHGVASLYPTRIEAFPFWFLPADKEGYIMTPASWDEMADPQDPYLKVQLHRRQTCHVNRTLGKVYESCKVRCLDWYLSSIDIYGACVLLSCMLTCLDMQKSCGQQLGSACVACKVRTVATQAMSMQELVGYGRCSGHAILAWFAVGLDTLSGCFVPCLEPI